MWGVQPSGGLSTILLGSPDTQAAGGQVVREAPHNQEFSRRGCRNSGSIWGSGSHAVPAEGPLAAFCKAPEKLSPLYQGASLFL